MFYSCLLDHPNEHMKSPEEPDSDVGRHLGKMVTKNTFLRITSHVLILYKKLFY